MIRRIVKMEFIPEHADDFAGFTHKIKDTIKNFEGCIELNILRDIKHKNVFFTYSVWQSEEALNKYRDSDFFNTIWPQAKKWFSEKPMAWSTEVL